MGIPQRATLNHRGSKQPPDFRLVIVTHRMNEWPELGRRRYGPASSSVKDIGRRLAYDILHSRKPRATGGELWVFRVSAGCGAGAPVGGTRIGGPGRGLRGRLAASMLARTGARDGHRSDGRCRQRERHRHRKHKTFGERCGQAMPGHGAVVPVAAVACGGARGCRQRSNVSMTTMCPPQHGHGGRTSAGSSGVSSSGGSATPSSCRACSRCALRVAPASRP